MANTRTARTSPAAKRAAKTPAPVDIDGFEPIRLSSAPAAAEVRVPLFYIDDVEYSIPRTVAKSVSLEYLRLARQHGEGIAAQRLLERLLGAEGYEALEQSDTVTDEQIEEICALAVRVTFGDVESGGKARTA